MRREGSWWSNLLGGGGGGNANGYAPRQINPTSGVREGDIMLGQAPPSPRTAALLAEQRQQGGPHHSTASRLSEARAEAAARAEAMAASAVRRTTHAHAVKRDAGVSIT